MGDLKQKLTTLETTIDGDAVLAAAEAVLEELSKDKQVEKMVRRVLEYVAAQEEFGIELDVDEAWDSVAEGIEDALDELGDADGDDMDFEAVLTQYVNNSHEVVGYALEVEDEQVLYLVEVKSGDKIAFELKIPNALEIVGDGTEKKGVVNAEYTVSTFIWDYDYETYESSYEKKDVLTISLVDFKAEGELVNGKIRIAPTDALLEQMDLPSAASSVIDLAGLQLELGLATTETSGTVEFNVLVGEDLFVGVAFTAAKKEASDISLPAEAYDFDNIQEWVETLDYEKVLQALKDAGLPIEEIMTGQSTGATTIY